MDKEKMMEEMAKDIHNAKRLSDYHCYEDEYTDCKKCKLLKYAENKMCQDAYEASSLIEDGWCKIPEGAVVLTKEEYDDLQSEYDKVYKQAEADINGNIANGGTSCHWCEDITKKETAKEIIKEVKALLKIIAQQYGVEIKE